MNGRPAASPATSKQAATVDTKPSSDTHFELVSGRRYDPSSLPTGPHGGSGAQLRGGPWKYGHRTRTGHGLAFGRGSATRDREEHSFEEEPNGGYEASRVTRTTGVSYEVLKLTKHRFATADQTLGASGR